MTTEHAFTGGRDTASDLMIRHASSHTLERIAIVDAERRITYGKLLEARLLPVTPGLAGSTIHAGDVFLTGLAAERRVAS